MLTKDAIQELAQAEAISAAVLAVAAAENIGPNSTEGTLALPATFSVHDLEARLPRRRRARGTMTTASVEAFAAYVQIHAEPGATVFCDQDTMTATAVLNLGLPVAPGHADNIARLAPKRTAAYLALLAIADGKPHTQAEVAEFIEDWMDSVRCRPASDADGDSDTPPEAMPARRAVAAIRRITIEAAQKQEATEGQLSATRSALESVKANSAGNPLPAFIDFHCVPFAGFEPRDFVCRVSVLLGDKVPRLVLRIAKAEQHQQAMAEELAGLVRKALGDEVTCMLGQYKPGA